MSEFGPKLKRACELSDVFFDSIVMDRFAELTIKVPILAKMPEVLCNGEFLTAVSKQQRIHRERKEREEKG